jgi:hypothetical protein
MPQRIEHDSEFHHNRKSLALLKRSERFAIAVDGNRKKMTCFTSAFHQASTRTKALSRLQAIHRTKSGEAKKLLNSDTTLW